MRLLQIDSIHVVARSPYLVLFARLGNYPQAWLEEALEATTINGARALAFADEAGSLEVGKRCDLILWDTKDYHELGYHFGVNLIHQVFIAGIHYAKEQ